MKISKCGIVISGDMPTIDDTFTVTFNYPCQHRNVKGKKEFVKDYWHGNRYECEVWCNDCKIILSRKIFPAKDEDTSMTPNTKLIAERTRGDG